MPGPLQNHSRTPTSGPEAKTCREFVLPRLKKAGWETAPHSLREQAVFTDGRITMVGSSARRAPMKIADYLLYYTHDYPLAVVEAKKEAKSPGDGLQQAKDYADILGLSFAYATNGVGIVEYDYLTGVEQEITAFPTPDDLWRRLTAHYQLSDSAATNLLTPSYPDSERPPRYYQVTAINRAVQAVLQEKRRNLLTLATGTGKTTVAFQIAWKLWQARWNREGAYRRPRILFLADRRFLVDEPKNKDFAPFGDARHVIQGEAILSREMYFSTYQSLAEDERRAGLYRDYPPDFFDLIVIDECHRGSADKKGSWREILEYFEPAYQLGMTATPRRADNVDTYEYFGNPLYTYSLRQGIDDGFLAPYRVHRVITDLDAAGWRPNQGDLDRFGYEIPDAEYGTKDFERFIVLRKRTEAIAAHLADFMAKTDRFAKTIVFCVDQDHADEMRRALNNRNADLARKYPDYVCRVTADEGDIGQGHREKFQDIETKTPVILTTSQLLTTGLNAPTCKIVVLARVVGSMTEFKQIIGRGTRVREDYGKMAFHIIDYTGSATRLFADPEFDGEPLETPVEFVMTAEQIDALTADPDESTTEADPEAPDHADADAPDRSIGVQSLPGFEAVSGDDPPDPNLPENERRRKYYVDTGDVAIVVHIAYDLATDGKKLTVVQMIDFTAEKVRLLCPAPVDLHERWINPDLREEVKAALSRSGIELDALAEITKQPDADPFDLLCHIAYNAPLLTRAERAERLRRNKTDFFDQYGPQARVILNELLTKYSQYGVRELSIPDVLRVPPLSSYGTTTEIVSFFGGANEFRSAVSQLQTLLYAV